MALPLIIVANDLELWSVTRFTGMFSSSFPEIPNFLSEEECGHMVNLAERERFVTSTAKGGLQSWSEFEIPDIRSKSQ